MTEQGRSQFPTHVVAAILLVTIAGISGAYASQVGVRTIFREDNEAFGSWSAAISISELRLGPIPGKARLETGRLGFQVKPNAFGIREIYGEQSFVEVGYEHKWKGWHGSVTAGVDSLEGKQIPFGGFQTRLPVLSAASLGFRLHFNLEFSSRVPWENPMMAEISERKNVSLISFDAGWGAWQMAAGYQATGFSSLDAVAAHQLLAESAFVSDFEAGANSIAKYYGYLYRPLFSWLYAGVFASYEDAKDSRFQLTLRDSLGRNYYTYLPYYTPQETWSTGLNLSLLLPKRKWLHKSEWKLTFPLYSRGLFDYSVRQGSPVFPWDTGTYRYPGVEPLIASNETQLALGKGFRLDLVATFYLKPYYRYGYLRSEHYRLWDFSIGLSKSIP